MDKIKVTGLSGFLAAGVGTICCVGPAVLASLGFGVGAIGFARDFGFLHLPMAGLAVLLLSTAFYLKYKTKNAESFKDETCSLNAGRAKSSGIYLWVALFFTLFLFTYPYFQ